MSYTQMILGAIVAVFLITFIATLVVVRRHGRDPKGVIGGHVGGAIITSGASLLWLAVALFYIFQARSITWFGRIALLDRSFIKGTGIAVCFVGLLLGIAGEVALGVSFRVAFPKEKTKLVTSGIYSHIRNPVALGAILLALGTFFVAPSWLAFLAMLLNIVGYEMKIRAEEAYLRQTHGVAYDAYCEKAGRYWPKFVRRAG